MVTVARRRHFCKLSKNKNEFYDIFIYFCLFSQIFRSLESPAEDNRISDLRENVIIQREQFLKKVTFLSNAADLSNFNVSVSTELEKYEFVSGSAPFELNLCMSAVQLFSILSFAFATQTFQIRPTSFSTVLRECASTTCYGLGHLIGIFDVVVCTKNVINFTRMQSRINGWGRLKYL